MYTCYLHFKRYQRDDKCWGPMVEKSNYRGNLLNYWSPTKSWDSLGKFSFEKKGWNFTLFVLPHISYYDLSHGYEMCIVIQRFSKYYLMLIYKIGIKFINLIFHTCSFNIILSILGWVRPDKWQCIGWYARGQ